MLIRTILYVVFCAFAGGATAAGYVAFITLLGVFEKLSEKYKANQHGRLIETMIITGVTLGNIIYLTQAEIPTGIAGVIFFNLMGGIFTGCLAGALAETLKVFPILSRRFNVRNYLPYVLISAALGKAVGSIISLIIFNYSY